MADTKIEWADKVWNPVIGCTKCSPGCLNCYAERFACRLAHMGQEKYQNVTGYIKEWTHWLGNIYCDKSALDIPLHWRKPKRIFVCSMSDLFHEKVPDSFLGDVFEKIRKTPQHTYLILTKRVKRMVEVANILIKAHGAKYFKHVHWGTSISTQPEADINIPLLLQIQDAAVRWLSIEPMLEGIDIRKYLVAGADGLPEEIEKYHDWIDWIVVGGESGPGARPMHPDWVRNIRDQCVAAGVPFYFKQWGAYTPDGPAQVVKNDVVFLKDGTWMYTKDVFRNGWGKYYDTPTDCIWMKRVGKKKSGCILDGKEWKKLPERK